MLLKRNTVNPTSRPNGGQVVPQGRLRGWRANERWKKPKPLGNRADRGWNITLPRKRADFQSVVTDEKASRTFA